MMHPTGEVSSCLAAKAKGIPYTLSTMGTTTIEEVAATGHPNLWFQLYVTSDRRLSDPLIDRAGAAGYKALEITIDTVVTGRRTARLRNGLTIPPQLSPRTIIDIGRRPGYWIRMLRSPAIGFANFTALSAEEVKSAASTRIGTLFDHSLNWSDVESIRARWDGPLLLKGPIGPADANARSTSASPGSICRTTVAANSTAAPRPIDMLAPLRASVGPDVPIVIDSGVRHGADIAVSIALGADWRSSAARTSTRSRLPGQRGVEHVIKMLTDQLRSVMQLSGVTTLAELRKHGPELLSDPG